jgi:hypothetical protein
MAGCAKQFADLTHDHELIFHHFSTFTHQE